jgi:hypothetical protein
MKPPKLYWDDYAPANNVYRQRDFYKERAEDLEELCGEMLTEMQEANQ